MRNTFLLYKKMCNDNKYFLYMKMYFLLYEMLYNNNKYFYSTLKCITYYTSSRVITIFISYYIRRYIIHESIYRIIQEDV